MMINLQTESHNQVDFNKRKTLVSVAGIAAGSVLAASPIIASASLNALPDRLFHDVTSRTKPLDLDITLVSIPDKQWETLKLVNLTGHEIVVERFHANKLIFEGNIIDCNDACAKSAITVPATGDRLIKFDHVSTNVFETGVGDYLDVHSAVEKLAEGTRIVRLGAYMINNAAVLTQSDNRLLA